MSKATFVGYYLCAETLRKLILDAPGATEDFKKDMLLRLEEEVIQGKQFVDSFQLGYALGKYSGPLSDLTEFNVIINEVRDLAKLPFIRIHAEPIN